MLVVLLLPENVLVVVEPEDCSEEWVGVSLRLGHQGLVQLNQHFFHVDPHQGRPSLAHRDLPRESQQRLVVGGVPAVIKIDREL